MLKNRESSWRQRAFLRTRPKSKTDPFAFRTTIPRKATQVPRWNGADRPTFKVSVSVRDADSFRAILPLREVICDAGQDPHRTHDAPQQHCGGGRVRRQLRPDQAHPQRGGAGKPLGLNLALVLDVSGSMYEEDGTGISRLKRIQDAAASRHRQAQARRHPGHRRLRPQRPGRAALHQHCRKGQDRGRHPARSTCSTSIRAAPPWTRASPWAWARSKRTPAPASCRRWWC